MDTDSSYICPNCSTENRHGAHYCIKCGIRLTTTPLPEDQRQIESTPELSTVQLSAVAEDNHTISNAGTELTDFRQSQAAEVGAGDFLPDRYDIVKTKPDAFRLRYGFQSHRGQVRDIDEDSLLTLSLTTTFEEDNQTALGLFVVSDGIGGHQAGELASRQAIQLIGAEIISRVFQKTMAAGRQSSTEKLETALRKAVEKANEHLYDKRKKLGNDMGATVTAVLIQNHNAIIANVGDSRTYLWRHNELQAITQDHSLVASLIAAGELAEEAIYTHEQKGVIYRSLGDKPQIVVDTFSLALAVEDRLILCCDGVWETIRDEGIEEVLLLEADPQRACDEIVKRANYAGGEDNISIIVILVDLVS